jgi:hypothetical protein
MFKDTVDFFKMCLPGLIQKCPFKGVSNYFLFFNNLVNINTLISKKMKVTNGSLLLDGALKEKFEKGPFQFLPNGIIRNSYTFSDELDEKILEFTYFEEINMRDNTFNGNVF